MTRQARGTMPTGGATSGTDGGQVSCELLTVLALANFTLYKWLIYVIQTPSI